MPVHAAAPVLQTERLTLRGHAPDDHAESARLWADPLVTQHIGGRPPSEEEAWARVLRYAGLWPMLGFGYWVVLERASGRFVGEVGLGDFRRAVEPPLGDVPEAGWVLQPWAHGRGFATEAVRAALAWADAQTGHPALRAGRTVCLIAQENVASVKVAERCGYRPVGNATYRELPTLVFARDAAGAARPAPAAP